MKISVIIPTYKPQGYIWECLDSLVVQTFPKEDFEVILVLNGCNEPYKTQIQDYLASHPSLQVNFIHTDEGGVSNARNIALDVAKGEYVTFIDDDDYVSPSYLEELYEKASPDTVSLCYPYAFKDGNKNEQCHYYLTDVYKECIKKDFKNISSKARRFFNGPWMKLIPLSFIQDRRFDVRFKISEDTLFMFLISDKFKEVAFTSEDATYYRRFRLNSAITARRKRWDIIKNDVLLMVTLTSIFSKGKYSFYLYSTRMLAAFLNMFK